MPNSRTLRWVALTFVALCAGSASLLHAGDSPTAQGNVILSSSTSGYYNGGEWPELTRTVLSFLYLVLIANEDEENYDSRNRHSHHGHNSYHHDDYYCDEELAISFPKAQLGFGLSYFVSPDLAVGGRYIYRHDFKDNVLERLWGGGPELTYYFGRPHHSVRPFVGGSLLFTRAVDRYSRERLEQGTSVNVRGGFNVALSTILGPHPAKRLPE